MDLKQLSKVVSASPASLATGHHFTTRRSSSSASGVETWSQERIDTSFRCLLRRSICGSSPLKSMRVGTTSSSTILLPLCASTMWTASGWTGSTTKMRFSVFPLRARSPKMRSLTLTSSLNPLLASPPLSGVIESRFLKRSLVTDRPTSNQTLELTASRRTTLLSVTTCLSLAVARVPARGSSSCSR
jgi:hypothetical protein